MPDWTLRIRFVRDVAITVYGDRLSELYGEDDKDAVMAYYFDHCDHLVRRDEDFDSVYAEEAQ